MQQALVYKTHVGLDKITLFHLRIKTTSFLDFLLIFAKKDVCKSLVKDNLLILVNDYFSKKKKGYKRERQDEDGVSYGGQHAKEHHKMSQGNKTACVWNYKLGYKLFRKNFRVYKKCGGERVYLRCLILPQLHGLLKWKWLSIKNEQMLAGMGI